MRLGIQIAGVGDLAALQGGPRKIEMVKTLRTYLNWWTLKRSKDFLDILEHRTGWIGFGADPAQFPLTAFTEAAATAGYFVFQAEEDGPVDAWNRPAVTVRFRPPMTEEHIRIRAGRIAAAKAVFEGFSVWPCYWLDTPAFPDRFRDFEVQEILMTNLPMDEVERRIAMLRGFDVGDFDIEEYKFLPICDRGPGSFQVDGPLADCTARAEPAPSAPPPDEAAAAAVTGPQWTVLTPIEKRMVTVEQRADRLAMDCMAMWSTINELRNIIDGYQRQVADLTSRMNSLEATQAAME